MGVEADEVPDSGYGESSRYAAHLDRGWALLDRGDLTAARTSVQHAQEVRPDDPDAAVLLGAVELAEGNADASLRCYERALELDPEYLEPYAAAAQVCLFDLDDPARALRYCLEATELEHIPVFEGLDLQLLAAECELALGRHPDAGERLMTLSEIDVFDAAMGMIGKPDVAPAAPPNEDAAEAAAYLTLDGDGEPLDQEERAERMSRLLQLGLRHARLQLDLGEGGAARARLGRIAGSYPDEADAWYLRSEAEHRLGDPGLACACAVRAWELDAAFEPPTFAPSPDRIEQQVREMVMQCPAAELRTLASPTLEVFVTEAPPRELLLEGVDPRTLALALATRSSDPDAQPVLTGLAIYRRNVARLSRDEASFENELRLSVYDELAMFLRLDDGRRTVLGLPPLPPMPTAPAPPAAESRTPEDDDEAADAPPRGRRRRRPRKAKA